MNCALMMELPSFHAGRIEEEEALLRWGRSGAAVAAHLKSAGVRERVGEFKLSSPVEESLPAQFVRAGRGKFRRARNRPLNRGDGIWLMRISRTFFRRDAPPLKRPRKSAAPVRRRSGRAWRAPRGSPLSATHPISAFVTSALDSFRVGADGVSLSVTSACSACSSLWRAPRSTGGNLNPRTLIDRKTVVAARAVYVPARDF